MRINIARIFANALARRVAVVLVAALLAWLGLGRAHAQTTQQQAYDQTLAQCQASQQQAGNVNCNGAPTPYSGLVIVISFNGVNAFSGSLNCPNSAGGAGSCGANGFTNNTCDDTDDTRDDWLHADEEGSDYVYCSGNCKYVPFAPTPEYPEGGWSNDGSVCAPSNTNPTPENPDGDNCPGGDESPTDPGSCDPPLDTDGDGVPDEDDAFPNDPSETTDSDGDGIGDNADTAPDDPTNGGDTGPGDETDNNASGGGVCGGAPPYCVGDGILCNTLNQVYHARCALQEIEGTAQGIKEGIDALVEGQGTGNGTDMGETNGLLADLKGILEDLNDWMHGDGQDDPTLEGMQMPEEEVVVEESWSSGMGGAAACPAPVAASVTILSVTQEIDFSFGPLCDFADYMKPLFLSLGAFLSGYILLGLRR